MERPTRARGRRMLLVALAALLLILLCVVVIYVLYPIIFPPDRDLVADAGGPYSVSEGQLLTLDGSASSGGNITDYTWDFGDGSTGSGVSPSHTYEDGPAQFTATLTVTDDRGRTAGDTALVTVNNLPPTADAGGPYTCQVGEAIQLAGACDDPGPVDAASLTCTWAEFSGAALSEPTYTCSEPIGDVTLTLTATDKDGASSQSSATVSVVEIKLSADANGPYIGQVGEPVAFDGSGSTPEQEITSYDWDFGDGETGIGVEISHTYAQSGTYTVTLTIAGADQEDTATTSATITAGNQPPTAAADAELIPKAEPCYRFIGSESSDPDGEIVSYAWDFGDQNTGTGEVVEYCYAEPGSYAVTLTVTDDQGGTDSASVDVSITE
ncbi:MAG: PKD domain-containing protein [Anaerolineales bacterium]|nr:MAG: PKD domain-containing protein [Anaerolineales bacterium]